MSRRIYIIPSIRQSILERYEDLLKQTKDKKSFIECRRARSSEIREVRQLEVGEMRSEAISIDCSEIVWGIPLALQGIITEDMLPCVFEEPEVEPEVETRNLSVEIDELKSMVTELAKQISK